MRLTIFLSVFALSGLASPTLAGGDQWSGPYIGAVGGYGVAERDITVPATFIAKDSNTPERNGWLGGVMAGYSWRSGAWLTGFEVDATLSNLEPRMTFLPTGGGTATWHTYTRFGFLASARGRLGYTFGNWMLYGTGGAAWMRTSSDIVVQDGGITSRDNIERNHFGWVAGLGAEYAISRNWTTRLEWLHYDFGRESYFYPSVGAQSSGDGTVDAIRVGFSYNF